MYVIFLSIILMLGILTHRVLALLYWKLFMIDIGPRRELIVHYKMSV